MTTTQMKQFIAAATCLNFTEAANSLFISPSSLSRQITAIERELNVQLFVRDNRSVHLTPAGKALLDDLKQLYDSYLQSIAHAQSIQRGEQSILNIGILDGHMISGQFPELIHQLECQYPNIAINLFRGSFGELSQALYNGTADIIITLEFSLREKEQIRLIPLSRTQDYLVMSRSNPLTQKKHITNNDLRGNVIIGISDEDSPYAGGLAKESQRSCGCGIRFAPNLETCTLWVQAGLGITVVNSHNYLAYDPSLCFVPLERVDCRVMPPVNSDLVVAWHAASLNPALPMFLEICQDHVRVSPPPVPYNLAA